MRKTTEGLQLASGTSTGTINLHGGTFDVEGATGTLFGSAGGTGGGVINLSAGTFEETGGLALTFANTASYINFTTGSTGDVSLFHANATTYDAKSSRVIFISTGFKMRTLPMTRFRPVSLIRAS